MHFDPVPKYDFDDVLITPKRSTLTSRREVELNRTFRFKHATERIYDGIPIIASNMDHTGTFEMSRALAKFGVSVALHKHYTLEQLEASFASYRAGPVAGSKIPTFYSMGLADDDWVRLMELVRRIGDYPAYINVDVANGYTEKFVRLIERLRDQVGPRTVIMAGNVVTGDMTAQLILSGADIVKVGIGPGSVCTTRKIAGVGYPQLSAIIECADAAHGLGGLICGDGGCKVPGDVSKAFAAGADFVMLGGMFAGHDECSGVPVSVNGVSVSNPQVGATDQHFMEFYGMSSDTAMNKYNGGVESHRASEGKTVRVPYKGPVANTIKEILGGVRSACTYVGAEKLKHLSKCTTFVVVNRTHNTVFGE